MRVFALPCLSPVLLGPCLAWPGPSIPGHVSLMPEPWPLSLGPRAPYVRPVRAHQVSQVFQVSQVKSPQVQHALFCTAKCSARSELAAPSARLLYLNFVTCAYTLTCCYRHTTFTVSHPSRRHLTSSYHWLTLSQPGGSSSSTHLARWAPYTLGH
jgi:hypothetical protein